jgi:hypothetical protein
MQLTISMLISHTNRIVYCIMRDAILNRHHWERRREKKKKNVGKVVGRRKRHLTYVVETRLVT